MFFENYVGDNYGYSKRDKPMKDESLDLMSLRSNDILLVDLCKIGSDEFMLLFSWFSFIFLSDKSITRLVYMSKSVFYILTFYNFLGEYIRSSIYFLETIRISIFRIPILVPFEFCTMTLWVINLLFLSRVSIKSLPSRRILS